MTPKKKIWLSACSALALAMASAEAAIVQSSGNEEQSSITYARTLRDRPLDEYIQRSRAAATDTRDESDFTDNYADDIGDGLFFAPGVQINGLDIQEPRIAIRGFSYGNNQHRSTVAVYRDGAPVTDVHGTSNTSEIDLQSTKSIKIYRGVANLREGGDNLGGAVNFVSKTGRTARQGLTARAEGDASMDGKPAGQAHIAIANGKEASALDYYLSATGVYENGFRDNNRRSSQQFHGNLGYRIADAVSTRLFIDIVNSKTELAGGLEPGLALSDPQEPTPPVTLGPLFPGGPVFNLLDGARQDDFARDIREGRVASNTRFSLLGHDIDVSGHYTRREVTSPQIDFAGFIEEEGSEWGVRTQFERVMPVFGRELMYRAGGSYATGRQDSDRFENIEGARGDITANTQHRSKNISGYVQGFYKPFKKLVVDLGAKFIRVERTLTDLEDDDTDDRSFTGISARAGAAYKLLDTIEVYTSVSRAYEPPSFYELIAEDATSFSGLDEQDSFTIEAGLRGSFTDWIGWDIAYYDTDVENEIINIADPSSFVNSDVFENVDQTTHKGVEAGIDLNFFPATMRRRDAALTLRNVYNYNNFRFTDADPLGSIDGNRIAGAPLHLYRGELRYAVNDRWFAAVNLSYTRGDHFADHLNEVSVPTGAVIGFSAGLALSENIELFASGENITDRAYVGGVTPVLSQNLDNARIFTPGAPASFYGGLRYKF
ncbi:TonB-dependent receptor [Hyphococcus flavus]|uniref:TonB-dependent receptor n=1 Tax=Hyphococcus flavus TaxID=1866326 RepID=A0AAE9ZG03_9PROT|nr:TonB-dependent receptor [Hyphococcus flavus]WDI30156.1 TonB-dependent receptor [Hyphococcus flavus]